MTASPSAPAAMPSEEDVAKLLIEARTQRPVLSEVWEKCVASFRELDAKHPDYIKGFSSSTDAFRQARAILAKFATITAENASLRETLRSNSVWDFPRDIQKLTVKLEAAEARALAAEAALAAERGRCAKIAESPSTIGGPGLEFVLGYAEAQRRIAAAIRAQGE